MTPLLLAQIVLTLFIFVALLSSAAAMVWVERRVAALLQQRRGPTRVGWQGLLQPFADVIKLMFKEELRPRAAERHVHVRPAAGLRVRTVEAAGSVDRAV